jgi:hypothetical protein
MDRNPSGTAVRLMRRLERLGSDPVCVLCGYANPHALIPVRRDLLERHHVVCKDHDGALTAPLCRNCHGEVTELLRQDGVNPRFEPNRLVRIALILTAMAVFFEMLAPAFRRWAEQLMEVSNEKHCESSRTHQNAKPTKACKA